MRKLGGRNRFWQKVAWKNYFCRFKMIEDQKRVILGISTRVWKNKSLIICVQEGGGGSPSLKYFV